MPTAHELNREGAGAQAVSEPFLRADHVCTFGPSFFMGQLGRFMRDQCPDPKETLPVVEIHLADGDTLDVCHIIGVSPRWVVLAVRHPPGRPGEMATELVPYELVRRVCIRARHAASGGTIGFDQSHRPELVTPEHLLLAAMAPDLAEDGDGSPQPSGQVASEQSAVSRDHPVHAAAAGNREP